MVVFSLILRRIWGCVLKGFDLLPFLMYLIIMGTATTSALKGQDLSPDSTQRSPYQVGISASSIFKLLEEGTPTQQYQVYGRYWGSSQRMGRGAVRYRHVVGEETEVDAGLRGGIAWVFRSERRWRFYAGGDLIAGYRRFSNGRESYRGGVSPLFGMLFFIGPHVSVSLEPRLVAAYARSQGGEQGISDVFSIEIDETALLILSVHF